MIPELESERLLFKRLSMAHCTEEYVAWLNNPQVYQYLETGGNYTLTDLRNYLTSVEVKPEMLFWAIHIKSNNIHIGNIKMDPINMKHGLGEYGILMGNTSEWGKGYAKEASRTIIKYCFESINLRKITLGVVGENISALELYKSLGFEVEGVYKKHGLYNNEYLDTVRMALFNPNYKDANK
ncbi:MAG: GNAT family protein [Cyclobacteriaceae bacterium]